jgi:outer membrane lipoprotein carrier protein
MDTGTAFPVTTRMRRAKRLLYLLCGLGIALNLGAAEADTLIQKVQSRYNTANTLYVSFSESYSIAGHRRVPEEGTLALRKPGKMRGDYTRPAGKLFVSDGKNVFLYTRVDNRVEKVPARDTEDMRAPLAFLLGRLDMKKEFRDFAIRAGEGGTWLDATAKSPNLPYEKVSILVETEGAIRNLRVTGRDQSLLQFSFSNEKVNPPLSDDLFRFVIPPGAEVVNAVEYSRQGK